MSSPGMKFECFFPVQRHGVNPASGPCPIVADGSGRLEYCGGAESGSPTCLEWSWTWTTQVDPSRKKEVHVNLQDADTRMGKETPTLTPFQPPLAVSRPQMVPWVVSVGGSSIPVMSLVAIVAGAIGAVDENLNGRQSS